MKIGLIGGSFDPVHYGHLILAQLALANFRLDKVIFIPAGKPPHKLNLSREPSLHRLNMVKLAVRDNNKFCVSDFEIKQNAVNYTYHTIEHFKGKYRGDRLFFILGPDLLAQLHTWGNSSKLLNLCTFVCGTNSGYSTAGISNRIISKVRLFDIPSVRISSTLIRNYLKKKIPVKYFTPQRVENYIYKHKLYK